MSQPTSTQHERLLRDYEALWNGDLGKLDVVAESFSFYDPAHPEGEVHGRDDFAAFVEHVHQAFPDWHIEKDVDGMLVDGDTVMLEWTVEGTHRGEFFGAPPSGRTMHITGMAKSTIRDGVLQEDVVYFDKHEMLEQLGFTFPDVVALAPKLAWGKVSNAL